MLAAFRINQEGLGNGQSTWQTIEIFWSVISCLEMEFFFTQIWKVFTLPQTPDGVEMR
jgi:hypothetical protein